MTKKEKLKLEAEAVKVEDVVAEAVVAEDVVAEAVKEEEEDVEAEEEDVKAEEEDVVAEEEDVKAEEEDVKVKTKAEDVKVKTVKAGEVKETPELSEALVKRDMIGTPSVEETSVMNVTSEVEAVPVFTSGELPRKRIPTVGKTTPVFDPVKNVVQNSANGSVIGAFTV